MSSSVPAESSTPNQTNNLESATKDKLTNSPSHSEQSLLEKISQAMDEANWAHTVNYEKKFFLLIATNEIASLRLHFIVKEAENTIILMISPERICPPDQIRTMADYLNLVNDFIPFGLFTLDFDDGEIRFRQSLDVEGVTINSTFIDKFLGTSVQMVRQFYLSFHDIMNGKSIEFVLNKLRNSIHESDNSSSINWSNVMN